MRQMNRRLISRYFGFWSKCNFVDLSFWSIPEAQLLPPHCGVRLKVLFARQFARHYELETSNPDVDISQFLASSSREDVLIRFLS